MELSERKQKILKAVIDEYLGTAEPVGSRIISKKNELGLSSATIRNEMADLEGMGFLLQPHTSAGRIPSDSGYRFYVNSLMKKYQVSMEAMESLKNALREKSNQLEYIIKKAGMITSALTNYITVFTTPEADDSQIKKFDLVYLGGGNVMLIIVTRSGVVKNQMIPLGISEKDTAFLGEILNKRLSGLSASEINFEKIQKLQAEMQKYHKIEPKVLIKIMNFVYEAIESFDETHVFVENTKSLFRYPEYSNLEKAQAMMEFLEDEKKLKKVIDEFDNEKGVSIKIGGENEAEELKDCSLVTVNYSLGNKKAAGKIGVIGPKRMDYAKVIANLDCISSHIDQILYQLYIGEDGE